MKKSEPAAIKTDGNVKEAPVVLLRTVLEPEKKPALKTEAKAGADKPEDPAAKTADKPDPDPSKAKKPAAKPKAKAKVDVKPEPIKAENPTPKVEAKPEPIKAETPATKAEAKPEPVKAENPAPKAEAKPEPVKAETPATKAEAKPEPVKAENPATKIEVKPEPPKAETPATKIEAKPEPVKAETPTPKAEAKPEPPKAQEEPTAGPPSVECKAQVVDSPLKMMKLEFDKRTNVIKQEMRNIQDSFLVIGFQLHWIKTNNMYRVLNYKNIMDYAEKEFGIKKTTCCNFINIIDTYAERDEHGEVIESIAECYRNFSSSQLIAMLGMPEEMQQQVTPDMTVREINRLRKGEPAAPAVDAPKAVISEVKPAPVQEAPKPAAPAPVQGAPRPAAPVSVQGSPRPAAPVPVQGAPKPVGNPAANGGGKPMEKPGNPEPRTLLEVESYSGYRSMVDKIDGMVKDVFKAGKRMKVKIICEEG